MKPYEIRQILMPSDMSDEAESAFKTATAMAIKNKAKLKLLNVIDYRNLLRAEDFANPVIEVDELYKKAREKHFHEWIQKQTQGINLQFETEVIGGYPAEEICSMAKEINADIIVIGSHGISGIREFFIGSDAYRVVKHAHYPVLTVPPKWNIVEHKKVLFPVRLVPNALEKYNFIQPFIKHNHAKLYIIGLTESYKDGGLSELETMINDLRHKLDNDHVEYSFTLYQHNKIAEKILEEADKYDADLIVITANLDYHLRDFFVGPFAQQVVNHSKRPVLSIRPGIGTSLLSNGIS